MSDLVQRLRQHGWPVSLEAAAEIERLKKENKSQQSRLDELVDKVGMFEVALAKAEACN
jgi:hypothetical protein